MNYLIIYQIIPEDLKVYYVENISEEDAQRLDACHDKYENSDDWPESEWLSNYLESKQELKMSHQGYFFYTHIIVTGVIL